MALLPDATIVSRVPDGVETEAINNQPTSKFEAESALVDETMMLDCPIDGVKINQSSGLFEDGVTQFTVRRGHLLKVEPGRKEGTDVSPISSDPELVYVRDSGVTPTPAGERVNGELQTNFSSIPRTSATSEVSQPEVTPETVEQKEHPRSTPLNKAVASSVHRQIIVDESMPAWYKPDVEVQRFPLTDITEVVDGKRQLSEASLRDWGIEFSQCERALLDMPEVFKLSDISQMGIRFSEHGRWMVHSRLDHSIDVMEAARRIAHRLELSRYETQLARLGGLLHDVGHIAFAHTGELIYRTIMKDPDYDHDDRSAQLLRSGDIHDVISHFSRADGSLLPDGATQEEAINPLHLVAIFDDSPRLSNSDLRELRKKPNRSDVEDQQLEYEMMRRKFSHIRFIVKEVADRAYLRTDVVGTEFSHQVRDAFYSIYDAFEQSVRIDPSSTRDEFGGRRVFFEDLAPARRLLAARDALYHEYSCNVLTKLAGVWLSRALEDAIKVGARELEKNPDADVLTAPRLQELGESEILSRFLTGRYRQWFYENQQQVGGCLEHVIAPVIAFPFGALTPAGQEYVLNSGEAGNLNESQFMRELRARAIERFPALREHRDDLLLVATEDYSKKMALDYTKQGQSLSGTLKRHLPDDRRYFLASIPTDGSSGISQAEVRELELIAIDLLCKPEFIKPGYAPMTETIFERLDKSLYVDVHPDFHSPIRADIESASGVAAGNTIH